MLEQPSLTFVTYDVDSINASVEKTAGNIMAVLRQSRKGVKDLELPRVIAWSMLVASCLIQASTGRSEKTGRRHSGHATLRNHQLSIGRVGQLVTIIHKHMTRPEVLKAGDVQVSVKAAGMDVEDLYVLAGKIDTRDGTSTSEYAGVVERVVSGVKLLQPGGRVMVMAPDYDF